jgi:hypothetical protein
MKQFFTLAAAVVLFSANAWAQCTPDVASGNPGITPPTDSLACIKVGLPYSQVIQIENFNSFTLPVGTASVQSLRVDSITNIPCGLSYATNPANATFGPGQTGCIVVTGTSNEVVGQYRLNIYVDVQVLLTTPFGSTTLPYNGEAASVVAQIEQATGQSLGVDFNYFLRVTPAAGSCPAIDRTTPNINRTASASCAPTSFTATVTGDTEVCQGQQTALDLTFSNGVPPYDILWSSGNTSASVSLGAGTYGVTAVDSNGDTATASVTVTSISLPVSDFTVTVIGDSVVVSDNSTGNITSGSYDFGGQGSITTPDGSFVFDSNGVYTITQIVNSDCGSDTSTQDVTINVIGINELGGIFSSVQIAPNPSNGNFNLKLVANETSPVSVKVLNLQGQEVYATLFNTVAGQASLQTIQMNEAASGIYIIQIKANDALITKKLIIK